jgi:hypothetical protein
MVSGVISKYVEGERNWCRIFRRGPRRVDQAPRRAIPEYVHPDRLVRWGVV